MVRACVSDLLEHPVQGCVHGKPASGIHVSKMRSGEHPGYAHVRTHAKEIKLSFQCQSFSAIARHELEAEHTGGAELTASYISHQQINTKMSKK